MTANTFGLFFASVIKTVLIYFTQVKEICPTGKTLRNRLLSLYMNCNYASNL